MPIRDRYDKRALLSRIFKTCKGDWKPDPEFGLDYMYLYSSPDRAGIEQEIKRALSRSPAVINVLSVYSTLQAPTSASESANLLISIQLQFDDGEEITYMINENRAEL